MKKIIVAFSSILSIICFMIMPLASVMASNENFTGFTNTPEDILSDIWSNDALPDKYESVSNVIQYLKSSNYDITNNDYFLYYVGYYNDNYYYTVAIDFQSANVTFENNVLTMTNVSGGSTGGKGITYLTDWYKNSGSSQSTKIDQFDSCELNFNTLSLKFYDGVTYSILDLDRYPCTKIWNIKSNIPDTLTADSLNVFVSFSPSLSGNVDREVISQSGEKSMKSQLYMQVVNQSNFDIQYKMEIYKTHQQSTRDQARTEAMQNGLLVDDNVFYDSDPIFIYYADSWVYGVNFDSQNTMMNGEPVKENKPSPWHFVGRGTQDIVTFDFTQINLLEGEEYTVKVTAIKTAFGCASEIFMPDYEIVYPELYQLNAGEQEIVYQSNFVMINYSDVHYDANNTNNGVKPFNGREGMTASQSYTYSRNARENQDGSIDYSSRNLYTNPNSWLSQQRSSVITNHNSYINQSSVPSSLNNYFNGVLGLITNVFGHMPKDFQNVYIYGFTTLVVLGIILKVVK